MNALALDLSLTRSGYAAPDGSGVLIPPKAESTGVLRLAWFRRSIRRLIHNTTAELVVLEGYSFGQARGNALPHLGELGGVVRLLAHDERVPFVEIAPATLKKYGTGRGNAGKAEVLVAATKRLNYDGHDHNVADALWLLTMALDRYGCDVPKMPQTHRAALDAVQWPKLSQLEPRAGSEVVHDTLSERSETSVLLEIPFARSA